jgi:hypothetical protein
MSLQADALAHIIARGNPDAARNCLLTAERMIQSHFDDRARRWQLGASGFITVLFLIPLMVQLAKYYYDPPSVLTGTDAELVRVLIWGLLGGFFSLLLRLRGEHFNLHWRLFSVILDGASRPVLAMIGAALVYHAYEAELVLGILKSSPSRLAALSLLGFAAGFSERLAQTVVSLFGREAKTTTSAGDSPTR